MKLLLIMFSIFSLCISCDPGHFGKTFIRNDSDYLLELKYITSLKDTTIIIQPNTTLDILHFGGLGAGQGYECCACEFQSIALLPNDTTKTLIKSISNSGNWIITNSNDRRLSSKEIICEFVILESDVQ